MKKEKPLQEITADELAEMSTDELIKVIVRYQGMTQQLRESYLANHAYAERLRLGIAKALEPYVYFHLSPWVNSTRYVSAEDKRMIAAHLSKMLTPVARVLSEKNPLKQLRSLVQQAYAMFLESYELYDFNSKITWKGEVYRVKDKKGVDPFAYQISKGEKTVFHKAPLAKLAKEMESSTEVGEVVGDMEGDGE